MKTHDVGFLENPMRLLLGAFVCAATVSCTAYSGFAYSIRDVKLADSRLAYQISCDGLFGRGDACRQHASDFCNWREPGARFVAVEDIGQFAGADGVQTRKLLFQCRTAQVAPQVVVSEPPRPVIVPRVSGEPSSVATVKGATVESADTVVHARLPESAFYPGSARLSASGLRELDQLVAGYKGAHISLVRVDGYSGSARTDTAALHTSRARAESVGAYLKEQGLAIDHFVVRGIAVQRPAGDGAGSKAAPVPAAGRRVEITIYGR